MTRAPLVAVGCMLVVSCSSPRLPHLGEEPVYPLRGKHTAVACEACHTDGFEQLPNTCVACHEVDRPAPDHYPGQACDDCHVEEGWEVVETPPLPTLPTDTGFDHDSLPEDQLCWGACHEADRPIPTHYADPKLPLAQWWDCSGCHEPDAWFPAFEHPARIPHGSTASPGCTPVEDENAWVTGCVGCHPAGTDTFVCYACHVDSHAGENKPESGCLACHGDAEPTACDSLR